MADQELRVVFQTFGNSVSLQGNGRAGSYFNIQGDLGKGRPELPFQGLASDHEGFAGWDADGTGPEPKRDGHSSQKYYIASRDYDGIDPDPGACFAYLLDNEIVGFQNVTLQLAYRGFTPGQIKMKMEVRGLGEDIEGEDWSYIYPIHRVNYYHSNITAELNGEPLFGFVCDTAISYQDVSDPSLGWWGPSAKTIVYDASAGSSADVQAVATSLFKDLEDRQIQTYTVKATHAQGLINSNGRTGGFWQVNEGKLMALPMKGTQVLPGDVSGQWTMAGHPFIVMGDITIPDGQTLEIDPGVWVKFSDGVQFIVEGSLQAIGDTTNTGSIVFTAVNPELGWGHIGFDGTSSNNPTSVFQHCIFEYGFPPVVAFSSPYNCGGAIGIREYNNIVIENCLFHHNRVLNDGNLVASGGAIALWASSPVIRNCVFSENSANWSGAIACYLNSSPEIVNCLFYGNKSLKNTADGGGEIVLATNSNPIFLNNTFVNNHSNFRGGALEIYDGSNPDLINNIFWGNTAPENSQIYISSNDCNVDIKYNDIEGGQAGIGPYDIGTGVYENNLDTDPFFADALALNYQLGDGSPCIDTGISDMTGLNIPPYDLLGNYRIQNGRIDMGPYEFHWPTGINNPFTATDDSGISVYLNPFFSDITFQYELKAEALVTLSVFNHLGQAVSLLVDDRQAADAYTKNWNAQHLPPGVYFYLLSSTVNRQPEK
jgi:hypothetical protein